MSLPTAACSTTWLVQPIVRLTANVGVNIDARQAGRRHHDAGVELDVARQRAVGLQLGERHEDLRLESRSPGRRGRRRVARPPRAAAPDRGSGARYTACPNPMIRRPALTSWRTQSGARSGVPIASRASSARLGAPPWSGPASAPIAAHTASATSAPVEATTRAVNVDALKPWSIGEDQVLLDGAGVIVGRGATPVVSYR